MKDWTPKYTPQQRQAIISAVLDDHIKVPQAIQLASQGELGDLPPFTVPLSSAYGIVDKERRRRKANRSAQQQIDDLYDQILQRTADELATLSKKPKLTATELNQARALLRLAKELDRRPKPTSNGQRQPDDRPESPRERSFIDDLAEQATARAAEAHDQLAETPSSPHEEPSTPDTSPTLTDAQRRAAEAILGVRNGLGVPTG